MRRIQVPPVPTMVLSLVATLTAWSAVITWRGFTENFSETLMPLLVLALVLGFTGGVLRTVLRSGLVVSLVQLLVTVVLVFALVGDGPPGPAAWRTLTDGLDSALDAARTFVAPVAESAPPVHPLLITAGAIALYLFDLIASTLRRVPLAGLVLLAVATAPVAVSDVTMTLWTFVLTALGFLVLLHGYHAAQLQRWGRGLSQEGTVLDDVDTRKRPGPSAPIAMSMSTGRTQAAAARVGVMSVLVAVLVSIALPTLDLTLFDGPAGKGGNGTVRVVNPYVDMRRDLTQGADVPLLSVVTDDPSPSYLRLAVLTNYNGNSWTPGDRDISSARSVDRAIPAPVGVQNTLARRTFDYSARATDALRSTWLPLMALPSSISAPGLWRIDPATLDAVTSDKDTTTAGLEYRFSAVKLDYDEQLLDQARSGAGQVSPRYTQLPADTPQIVGDLADQVTKGQDTLFRKARALQQWFRVDGGFTYSLDVPTGNGNDSLETFLSTGPDGRRGYCEQYASAMAVMARDLGIPARVAVGFLRPDQVGEDGKNGEFVYSTRDMHAWPELYFPGSGWVAFEPTPADRASRVPDYTRGELPALPEASASASSQPSSSTGNLPVPSARPSQDPQSTSSQHTGQDSGFPWWRIGIAIAVLALGTLLVLTPGSLRAARSRRRRHRGTAEAAWAEVRDRCRDLGLNWPQDRTARITGRWLVGRLGASDGGRTRAGIALRTGPGAVPEATAEVERLVGALEAARYSPEAGDRPIEFWPTATLQALGDGATSRARLRARWFPASVFSRSGSTP